MPVRDDALLASLRPVHVTEPCPASTSAPDGSPPSLEAAAALEPMLGQVLAYGSQIPEEFGGYGLIWNAPRHAVVFAAFVSDLNAHRAALKRAVSHPEDLVVCQVAVSERVARALMAKLIDDLQGHFASIGVTSSRLTVVLLPGEHGLAQGLTTTYGDAVTVTVCSAAASCGPVVAF